MHPQRWACISYLVGPPGEFTAAATSRQTEKEMAGRSGHVNIEVFSYLAAGSGHRLRSSSRLTLAFPLNNARYAKSFSIHSVKLWNELPLLIRESPSVASLRDRLKKLWKLIYCGPLIHMLRTPKGSVDHTLSNPPLRVQLCSDVDDYNDGFVEAVHTIGSNFFKTRRTRTNKLSRSGLRLMKVRREMLLQSSGDA
ncbi:hypothetical protein MSG28_015119 [Choristoneura fumiferana]|uniref:Uncharacterized protein n=1 Tax=Choristoneura fumiferana TaxID=7141 RepID=A0ACC0KZ81_CHOFU|nr:hypothetical protein MSG28_015119 [Choristoneura fumiferana]